MPVFPAPNPVGRFARQRARTVRLWTAGVAAGVLLGCPGCLIHPAKTRLPELSVGTLSQQRRLAEYHDPFPEEIAGPDLEVRPSGFSRPRTETRRAAELRGLQLLNPGDPLPKSAGGPPRRYAGVVDP